MQKCNVDLRKLEDYSFVCMVCLLQQVKPQLVKEDATVFFNK